MVEQSDADDQLRSALQNQFHNGFTENIGNTITDYIFMAVYRRMCVLQTIGERNTFSERDLQILRLELLV